MYPFKTPLIKIKPQVLETIHANLHEPNKKVQIKIVFDNEDQLRKYTTYEEQRRIESELEVDMESSSQDEAQQSDEAQSVPKSKTDQATSTRDDVLQENDLKVDIEKAIVLKNFYIKNFETIGKSNGSDISILPSGRIRFRSNSVEAIEDSMEEVQSLMKNIKIERLNSKYGRQIFQSPHYRNELQKLNVNLILVLNKYYIWYDLISLSIEEKKNKVNKINEVLEYMGSKFHQLIDMVTLDRQNNWKLYQKARSHRKTIQLYRSLQVSAFKEIFRKQLEPQLKKTTKSDKKGIESNEGIVEINQAQDALILHCLSEQFAKMTCTLINNFYQGYDFFFLRAPNLEHAERMQKQLSQYSFDIQKKESKNSSFSIIGDIYDNSDKDRFGQSQNVFIHFVSNIQSVRQRVAKKENFHQNQFYNQQSKQENDINVEFCIAFHKPRIFADSQGREQNNILQGNNINLLDDSSLSNDKESEEVVNQTTLQEERRNPKMEVSSLTKFFKGLISEVFEIMDAGTPLCVSVFQNRANPYEKKNQFDMEKSPFEPILHVTPKQTNLERYKLIVDQFISKKYYEQIEKKRKQIADKSIVADKSMSIDVTNVISDSTLMYGDDLNDNSMSISMVKYKMNDSHNISRQVYCPNQGQHNSRIKEGALSKIKQNSEAICEASSKALQSYSLFIQETNKQYNNKYDPSMEADDIVQSDQRNRSIQNTLLELLKIPYKVYKIKVHPSHKKEGFYSDNQGKIVTVFVSFLIGKSLYKSSEKTGLEVLAEQEESTNTEPQFNVKLLTEWSELKSLKKDGFLLNINKNDIIPKQHCYSVRYSSHFEVAKQVQFLKQ